MLKQEKLVAFAGLVAVVWLGISMAPTGETPRELYESAKSCEQQAESSRAYELYRAVIERYPDSHFARYSRHRLQRLHL